MLSFQEGELGGGVGRNQGHIFCLFAFFEKVEKWQGQGLTAPLVILRFIVRVGHVCCEHNLAAEQAAKFQQLLPSFRLSQLQ